MTSHRRAMTGRKSKSRDDPPRPRTPLREQPICQMTLVRSVLADILCTGRARQGRDDRMAASVVSRVVSLEVGKGMRSRL
jgi:hypothetical protein